MADDVVQPAAAVVTPPAETISTPVVKTEESTSVTPPVTPPVGEAKVEPVVEKPADAKPVVPEKYDLKPPEGSVLDAKAIETVTAQAKAMGLTNEQAQAYLNDKDTQVRSFHTQQKEALDARRVTWADAVKNDKELGGDNLNESVETAKRFVKEYASDALKKELDDTGLGNHPELIRMLARAGKAMKDDKTVFPGSQGGSAAKSIEDVFYGGTKQK